MLQGYLSIVIFETGKIPPSKFAKAKILVLENAGSE
jgi:hypothetical protein